MKSTEVVGCMKHRMHKSSVERVALCLISSVKSTLTADLKHFEGQKSQNNGGIIDFQQVKT